MRTAFVQTLVSLAREDERIYLLTGDLGFNLFDPFIREFPDRFINAGIAEQNMIGVAAGLALCGKVVFTYSIGNFGTFRCLEQIRNDVCYHRLDVVVVSAGMGFTYGTQGYTHHGVEDLAVLRALPHMRLLCPSDPAEAAATTRSAVSHGGPAYLRLGANTTTFHDGSVGDLDGGRMLPLCPGSDITLLACGAVLKEVLGARELLQHSGVLAEVLSVPVIQPLNCEDLLAAASRTGRLVTVEEHGVGGMGSIVAEALLDAGSSARLARIHSERAVSVAACHDTLKINAGISAEAIAGKAMSLLGRLTA